MAFPGVLPAQVGCAVLRAHPVDTGREQPAKALHFRRHGGQGLIQLFPLLEHNRPDAILPGCQRPRQAFHDLPKESDALGAFAFKLSAPCPPENLVIGKERLSVGAVRAAGTASPEAPHHFLAADAAPEVGQIALIAAFVDDHGLFVFPDPAGDFGQPLGLQAGVGDVFPGVIPETHAVVIGQKMMEGVVSGHIFLDLLPIGQGFFHVQIVLVGQAPPDAGPGGQAAQQVIQIDQVIPLGKLGKAPAVIGMEQDQVDLDIHIGNAL